LEENALCLFNYILYLCVVSEETLPENVYNENHIEKRNRDNFVAENYGPAKLPRLEKIVYKVNLTTERVVSSQLHSLCDN